MSSINISDDLDYDVMEAGFKKPELGDRFGFRVVARPREGFANYTAAEHKGRFSALKSYFEPNQTLMVEIVLRRHVDRGVFQYTRNLTSEEIGPEPMSEEIP